MRRHTHTLYLPTFAIPSKVTVLYGKCVICGKFRARYNEECTIRKKKKEL